MDTQFRIMESCMRPSGAWAESFLTFLDEAEARKAFAAHFWHGPAYGITWSKTLTLTKTWWAGRTYQREVLATRYVSFES